MSLYLNQRPARRLFNERRNDGRDREAKGALVRSARGTAECVVRDQSEGGARLRFARPGDVPDRFDIKIGNTGPWRSARVRWRRADEVGIAFE